MEDQSGRKLSVAIATEFRAELAVQKRTANDFAQAIGVTPHTAGRKLAGGSPLSVIEMAVAAEWLGVAADAIVRRAEHRVRSDNAVSVSAQVAAS